MRASSRVPLDGLDAGLAARGFGARRIAEPADLHVEAGQQLLQAHVAIAQPQLLGMGAAQALLVVQRAETEWPWPGGVVGQPHEADVLGGELHVHAAPCPLELQLQSIGEVRVLRIARRRDWARSSSTPRRASSRAP